MKSALKASVWAVISISLCGSQAFAQTILNQSKDDLLKDFDVGKSLTAPAGPQFSGTSNPAPPASWAPDNKANAMPPAGAGAQPPGLIGNYTQGPNQTAQQKGILQRIIEGAMNAVNVSNNDGNGTHVKAPFVDVNVGGPDGVRVKAPFVKYNSGDGAQVKAPFVNINSPANNSGSSLK